MPLIACGRFLAVARAKRPGAVGRELPFADSWHERQVSGVEFGEV